MRIVSSVEVVFAIKGLHFACDSALYLASLSRVMPSNASSLALDALSLMILSP